MIYKTGDDIKNNNRDIILSRVYTFTIIVSPLLFVYGISHSLNTLSIREVAFILLFFPLLVTSDKTTIKVRAARIALLFLIYVFFIATMRYVFLHTDISFLRIVRYILLNSFIFLFAYRYFDFGYGMRVYKVVCIASTTFLMIQALLFRAFDVAIPGRLSILPLRQGLINGANFVTNSLINRSVMRLSSFFEEPAYYAAYVCVFLSIYIWHSRRIKPALIIFLSIGVLLSTSILGLATLGFLLFLVMISNNDSHGLGKNIKNILAVTFFAAFIVTINTRQFSALITRIFASDSNSVESRFIGYYMFLKELRNMPIDEILFGNSMSNQNLIIVSGYVVIMYYFGIVGATLFLTLIIKMYSYSKYTYLVPTFLVLLFLNIGSGEFASGQSFIIISAIILGKLRDEQRIREKQE